MFKCPGVIKHENNRDAAFLAISTMECIKDNEKGLAIYGNWIIISASRDYLSESGMIFISNKDLSRWHEYVPRN